MALGAGMDGGEQMTVQQEQVWAHEPEACAHAQRRFGVASRLSSSLRTLARRRRCAGVGHRVS
jgi:hypothetical protein